VKCKFSSFPIIERKDVVSLLTSNDEELLKSVAKFIAEAQRVRLKEAEKL
jgi:hypothetical protein